MHPLLSDPWVAAQIDEAVEPYRRKWTARQIELFREKMAWALATHPNAQRLLARERPKVVEQSGEVRIGGDPGAGAEAGAGGEAADQRSKAG